MALPGRIGGERKHCERERYFRLAKFVEEGIRS
jgi:hypothetical protein